MNTLPGIPPEAKLRVHSLEKGTFPHHLWHCSQDGTRVSPTHHFQHLPQPKVPGFPGQEARRGRGHWTSWWGQGWSWWPDLPIYTFSSGCGLPSISLAPPSFHGINRKPETTKLDIRDSGSFLSRARLQGHWNNYQGRNRGEAALGDRQAYEETISGVHLNPEHCGGPTSLSLVSGDGVKRLTARMLALDF